MGSPSSLAAFFLALFFGWVIVSGGGAGEDLGFGDAFGLAFGVAGGKIDFAFATAFGFGLGSRFGMMESKYQMLKVVQTIQCNMYQHVSSCTCSYVYS